ncbi:hypothetical protein BDV18DRAFT_134859 [Aspergillus unguis]
MRGLPGFFFVSVAPGRSASLSGRNDLCPLTVLYFQSTRARGNSSRLEQPGDEVCHGYELESRARNPGRRDHQNTAKHALY